MVPGMSQFQFYSVGIVAANKPLKSRHIEVTPMEDSPMLDGEITDNQDKYESKGSNSEGQAFEVSLKTTASIRALWVPFGDTNRKTAPDVRRGERVAIYRFGDADEYFWTTMTHHEKIRRLETVVYAFSNNSKENIENDSSSTYYFEISTHTKLITFHTAKNDGEFCSYNFQVNTKLGNFTFEDDIGNFIFLDSKEKQIKMRNIDDSFVDINRKIITLQSLDKIILNTQHVEINADATLKLNTNDFTTTTQGYQINAPVVKFSADITAAGTVQGGTISGGTYRGGHHG